MTVMELIQKLQDQPLDSEVYFRYDDYEPGYGNINLVEFDKSDSTVVLKECE